MEPTKQITGILLIPVLAAVACVALAFSDIAFPNKVVEKHERGENLVFNICGQCHYNESEKKFTGIAMEDVPDFMGKIHSTNLTHNLTNKALNDYNEEQLFTLIKTGKAKDDRFIPYMLRPNLSDDDIKDIIHYFRSDAAPVVSSDTSNVKSKLSLAGKLAMKFSGKPIPYKTGILTPDKKDKVAYGAYLVDNIGCYHCHSASITSLDYNTPSQSKNYMEGGMKFKDSGDNKIFASNLTPDKETGIGSYNKVEFRIALRDGVTHDGRKLKYPMRKYPMLTHKQSDTI